MSQNNLNAPPLPSSQLWNTPWPPSDLEYLSACPACGCPERILLYEGLIDSVFHCAPGKWTSWRCTGCHSAYLNPRPSRASIHRAYDSYFTHQEVASRKSYEELSPYLKLTRRLENGYTNFRYSTRKAPAANLFGPLVFLVIWTRRMMLDREYRHLPRIPVPGGKLLDVGCGSGAFLQTAKSCGWDVVGVDPDPKAVASGLRLGLNVRQGGIEQFDNEDESFDIITLSHVIEHVHDPAILLKAIYRLLKPGGQLWLETPNINSLGRQYFSKNWRGLEPPRHLILFNRKSLIQLLTAASFSKIKNKSGPRPLLPIAKASEAIKHGLSINDDIHLSCKQKWTFKIGELWEALFPKFREFLTLVASKTRSRAGLHNPD